MSSSMLNNKNGIELSKLLLEKYRFDKQEFLSKDLLNGE
jgi:hypothetical protein